MYYCLLTFLDCLTALALKVCVLTLVQVFFTLKLNSRFLHSVFDLTTHNSYFTILVEVFTKHILAENTQFTNHTEWTEHKMTKTKQLTIQTFICYLIYFGSRKLFHKIIQHTFHSRHTTCNLKQKRLPQRWFWKWLFRRIPSMIESFCKNFQFIIDIWQGSNAFELVDVSYYKEVRLRLTRIFKCYYCIRKFIGKLMAFFEKG